MNKTSEIQIPSKRFDPRWRMILAAGLVLAFTHSILRVALLIRHVANAATAAELIRALGIGLLVDIFVVLVALLPWVLTWSLSPRKAWTFKLLRGTWNATFPFLFSISFFLLAAEFFFFEEFLSRFNTVAVDYLIYPHEVFINIWESYPVLWVIAVAFLLGSGVFFLLPVSKQRSLAVPFTSRDRCIRLALWIALAVLLWPLVGNRFTRFSNERTLNEMAGNGWYCFVQAAFTRELEYAPFYKTIPLEQAYQRVRVLTTSTPGEFLGMSNSIQRKIPGDPAKPKLNVVILLEESLGSEFFGCLGRQGPTCTPALDKLSAEGLLFTNIYASGNRTVRGMEGVLCSYPPLPGDSVVVRSNGKPVETIARVLKRDDYSTTFIYAGRGLFDHVRSFMTSNGYDRFIEQKDFPNPKFSTIWGVCNEDLYQRGLEECRRAHASGKPFLLTMLSVSNHKPFTYPEGCIPEDPRERKRENAVKYTDYAIGKFFESARQEPFWTNTLFVVVADHGARVYGKQTIPMKSYEIPFLILGPAVVKKPERVGVLGGQIDVAPTLLGLINRPYVSSFFGRNLLEIAPESGRALLHHNRDIGLFQQDQMVVLNLNKRVEYYRGAPKKEALASCLPDEILTNGIELDAISMFEVADDLYTHDRYVVDEAAVEAAPSPAGRNALGQISGLR